MKPTKRQRHKYYKIALDNLSNYDGVCFALCIATGDTSWEAQDVILDKFPEFKSRKPKRKQKYDHWWHLNENGFKKRKAALRACIRETEPKTQKALCSEVDKKKKL